MLRLWQDSDGWFSESYVYGHIRMGTDMGQGALENQAAGTITQYPTQPNYPAIALFC